jgi:methionine--tRNA ligase beta chain
MSTSALQDLQALKRDVLAIRTVVQKTALSQPTMGMGDRVTDTAWFPATPPGHSEYSWPAEENAQDLAVLAKRQEKKNKQKQNKQKQKEKKQQQQPKTNATNVTNPDSPPFYRMEIVVGKIISCEKHPDADSLYVEQIDCGNGDVRQIVSGLVNYVPLNQMIDSSVMVIRNLKPAPLRKILSSGMVLAGADGDRKVVELLKPPVGTPLGARVYLDGDSAEDVEKWTPDTVVNPKKKKNAWMDIAGDLSTDGDACALFQGKKLRVETGFIQGTAAVANGNVS